MARFGLPLPDFRYVDLTGCSICNVYILKANWSRWDTKLRDKRLRKQLFGVERHLNSFAKGVGALGDVELFHQSAEVGGELRIVEDSPHEHGVAERQAFPVVDR